MTQAAPPPGYVPAAGWVPAPPPPPKKTHRLRNALIGLAALIVIIVVVSNKSGTGVSGGPSGPSTVVYSITSDASSVLVTYATLNNGSIGEQQDTKAAPPWSKTVQAGASFVRSFTLTASMNAAALDGGHDGTKITCKITVDGKTVAQQTSTGQYATVLCSAS